MVALQLGSVIGWWICLTGEEAHETGHCPTNQPIAGETSGIRRCVMESVFQNNRVTFRFLPENRDAHDPAEPCISSKIPRLNGNCPAQLPEKWLGKQGPGQETSFPTYWHLPRPYLSKSLVLVLPSKRSFDDWSNSLDNQNVSDVPLCINIVRTANH